MSQAKQEQSENRPHRTHKSGEPQYEYKMRKHSHEGIEMQMHHIIDHKLELVIPRVFKQQKQPTPPQTKTLPLHLVHTYTHSHLVLADRVHVRL